MIVVGDVYGVIHTATHAGALAILRLRDFVEEPMEMVLRFVKSGYLRSYRRGNAWPFDI
jgi:hypothetical protein